MEEVSEFKYLGLILCKLDSMEGERRKVIGSLEHMMKVKKGLCDGIIVSTIIYASETWSS